jgi:hypothetical protein
MPPPYQSVTIVAQGGTPVHLANQRGAPYPTTGEGALVFSNGAVLQNVTLTGIIYDLAGVDVARGSLLAPSITFGGTVTGWWSGSSSNVSLTLDDGAVIAPAASLAASFSYPGDLTLTRYGIAASPPALDDSQKLATTAWVNDAVGVGLTVGATLINSGTTTRVLYDNAGVLGEYAISGTGSVAMTDSPTLTGTLTATTVTATTVTATTLTGVIVEPFTSKAANYTITSADSFVLCLTNAFTLTLPTAVGLTGQKFHVKNGNTLASGNNIAIATTSAQTIDGDSSAVVTPLSAQSFVSDGSNWWLL